ncbi:MAG: peptidylprolyl isomerase [Pyrinomonadaceae bacterium]|jgi:peptidyl-prolyl cis-trans isomerase B (cyclophilin B)|nr:peptidylprolyl isomerase [Pyrinomonadaceae bacterium]
MRYIFIAVLIFAFSMLVNAQPPAKKTNVRPSAKPAPKKKLEPFETATVEQMAKQCVKIETEVGSIELEMFPEFAPETVRNFLNLVAYGAFNMTTFSRVVPNFVIQGGNPSTREPYNEAIYKRMQKSIPDEPNKILHERGILSMARSDEPNSASSSFFILVNGGSHLDGKFSAFGKVTKGLEIVDSINKMKVENEKPEKPVKLTKVSLFACEPQKTTETPK